MSCQDDQPAEVDLQPDDLKGAFNAMLNAGSQESTKSQQEAMKPTDPNASESQQEASRPTTLHASQSQQEASRSASLNVSRSPCDLNVSYGNASI